ncbi:MAG: hypothetical protein WC222_03405 [Parachlamydiales bacterium]|jgi:hypothetical protein
MVISKFTPTQPPAEGPSTASGKDRPQSKVATPLSGAMIGTSVVQRAPTGPFPKPQPLPEATTSRRILRPQPNPPKASVQRVSFQKVVNQSHTEQIKEDILTELNSIHKEMDSVLRGKRTAIFSYLEFEESFQSKALTPLSERAAIVEKIIEKNPRRAKAILAEFNAKNNTNYTLESIKKQNTKFKVQVRELNKLSKSFTEKLNNKIENADKEVQGLMNKFKNGEISEHEYIFAKDKVFDKIYNEIENINKLFETEKSSVLSKTSIDILRELNGRSESMLHMGSISDELITKFGTTEEKNKHSTSSSSSGTTSLNVSTSLLLNRVLTRVTSKEDNLLKEVRRSFEKVKPLLARYNIIQQQSVTNNLNIPEMKARKQLANNFNSQSTFTVAATQQNYDNTLIALRHDSHSTIEKFKSKKITQEEYLTKISALTRDYMELEKRVHDAQKNGFQVNAKNLGRVQDNMKVLFTYNLNFIAEKGPKALIKGNTLEAKRTELESLRKEVIAQVSFLNENADRTSKGEVVALVNDEYINNEREIQISSTPEYKQKKLDESINEAAELSKTVAERVKKGSISDREFLSTTAKLSNSYHSIQKQLKDNPQLQLRNSVVSSNLEAFEKNLSVLFTDNLRRIIKYGASRAIRGPELENSIQQYIDLRDSVEFQIKFIASRGGTLPSKMNEVIRKLEKHHQNLNDKIAEARKGKTTMELDMAMHKFSQTKQLEESVLT